MLGVEVRRVDRLLQVQPPVDVVEEDVQSPLLLLVAAGRAVREPRLAVAQDEPRRQRRARPRARDERRREALLEPEHLRARPERPAECGDRRRALEPAASKAWPRRRSRTGRRRPGERCRRASARRRRATRVSAGVRRVGRRPRPGRSSDDASSDTSLRRSSLYSAESSTSSGTGSASPYAASRSANASLAHSVTTWTSSTSLRSPTSKPESRASCWRPTGPWPHGPVLHTVSAAVVVRDRRLERRPPVAQVVARSGGRRPRARSGRSPLRRTPRRRRRARARSLPRASRRAPRRAGASTWRRAAGCESVVPGRGAGR